MFLFCRGSYTDKSAHALKINDKLLIIVFTVFNMI